MTEENLADVFEQVFAAARQRESMRQEHRSVCAKRPCERCEIWVCGSCSADTEIPADDRDGSRKPALCADCLRRWERVTLLERANMSIPARFRWADPGSSASKELMSKRVPTYRRDRLRLWDAFQNRQSVVLSGKSGCGKTSLGCYMLRCVIERGMVLDAERGQIRDARDSLFVPARDLGLATQEHGLGKSKAPIIQQSIAATFLVIDDLGSESDQGRQTIIDVIAARHDRNAPTWATTWLERAETNQKSPAFSDRYGGGTLRRLTECDNSNLTNWFSM